MSKANIFATLRFISEITERFKGSMSLDIYASKHNVQRYIDSYMLHLPSFVRRSLNLQEEIKSNIVKAVDKMCVSVNYSRMHTDLLGSSLYNYTLIH
jgi:hypothetical protein